MFGEDVNLDFGLEDLSSFIEDKNNPNTPITEGNNTKNSIDNKDEEKDPKPNASDKVEDNKTTNTKDKTLDTEDNNDIIFTADEFEMFLNSNKDSKAEDKKNNPENKDNTGNNKDSKVGSDEEDASLTPKSALLYLKENGLVELDEDDNLDELEEPYDIYEKIIKNYQKQAYNALLDRVDESIQDAIKYALKGGNDRSKLISLLSAPSDIDIDKADDEVVVKFFLQKTTKWDSQKIDKYLSTLDEDDFKEEALNAKEELKGILKQENQEALAKLEAEEKKREADNAKFIQEFKLAIDSSNFLDSDRRPTVKNFILNPVNKGGVWDTDFSRTLKKIQSNKDHLIQLADLLIDYNETKGLSYERILKKDDTRLTKNIKSKIEKNVANKLNGKANDWTHLF